MDVWWFGAVSHHSESEGVLGRDWFVPQRFLGFPPGVSRHHWMVPQVSTSVDFTNDDSEKFLRLFLEQIAERTRMAELRPEPVLGGHLARGKSRKVLFVQNPFIARFWNILDDCTHFVFGGSLRTVVAVKGPQSRQRAHINLTEFFAKWNIKVRDFAAALDLNHQIYLLPLLQVTFGREYTWWASLNNLNLTFWFFATFKIRGTLAGARSLPPGEWEVH